MPLTVEIIETSELGDRSYLAHDGAVAVVIDPQRDTDRVTARAAEIGVRVVAVAETHIHNDYVTGGYHLAQETGADYLVNAEDPVAFERVGVSDGDVRTYGDLEVKVVSTPGHTHTHLGFVIATPGTENPAVFTGGSLLYGSVGRPDLLGPDHTDTLARAQYRTAHKLAEMLPDEAPLYPTHGFGSFCSAGSATGGDGSTIGTEKARNDALTTPDEQSFVDGLVAALAAYPAYYAHMAPRNLEGPAEPDLSAPESVDAAGLRAAVEAGHWVVDLRDRKLYPAAHVPGSISVDISGAFSTYLGWILPWGTPLTLIAGTAEDVAAAQRQLVRIGIERPAGAAVGAIADLTAGDAASYETVDFEALATRIKDGEAPLVLDVRMDSEHLASEIPGSVHVPLHELLDRLDDVPAGQVWVHCQSGFRASIAASLLDRAGRDVVLVDDDYDRAGELGLTASA
ncbi:rhodanese-like domain-containing protein [Nocardioides bruguierae]|uniref:MBL fold metallo-hydrolase n=1 Tax=Nocardioides bruguierae TaxID=2945102 RepID=A0A9X2IF97_9ACTN|nr:MBL fold metallo-hydrolase [Nocardioides bruguierae]MCM0619495.1 MBL fold metallo-hydrolase [Nocardioides bruguierae]